MLRFTEIYEIWRRDSSLKSALKDSRTMLERTNRMFRESVRSLRESEEGKIEVSIYEEDREVNRYQQEVRRKVLHHLAITGGLNAVPGLILVTIVIDIERIGDYTKNIMELAVAHPRKLVGGRFEPDVRKIEIAVGTMFDRIVSILEAMDADAARDLIAESIWIRARCDAIVTDLIKGEEPALSARDAVAVALYVRYLKRVGAHLMNVLSSVVNPFEKIGYRAEG